MAIDLSSLNTAPRLLFSIELTPLQGQRFQPTGFPNLGAATYQTPEGTSLLLESAQSMANRLELVCWDEARQAPLELFEGLSHVRVTRKGDFLTDTMLESHRINSPYLLEGKKDKSFLEALKEDLGGLDEGPIDRRKLCQTLLKFDIGCLLHGMFLAKKELAGGRLRLARALTAFVEADQAQVAASGGVKMDHVNPKGQAKDGFGHVPFARDEYTAQKITLYVNLDLAQLRAYGLGEDVTQLLTLLALYKLRALLEGSLRFRTACDLQVVGDSVKATAPAGFELPGRSELELALKGAISECGDRMEQRSVSFDDKFKQDKEAKSEADA